MKRMKYFWILFLVLSLSVSASAAEAPVGELARLLTGTNPPGSTVAETLLGDTAADAVRQATGADIALVNGGYIVANLQPGEVYEADIEAVFSAPEKLVTLVMTRDELLQWLETGVSHVQVGSDEKVDTAASSFDGFPQVSGFRFQYDASAPAGERIFSLTLDAEKDPLTVACTSAMAGGAFGYAPKDGAVPTDHDLVSAMTAYFSGRTVELPETGRIECVGTADNALVKQYPALLFLLVTAGILLLSFRSSGKKKWLDV